MKNLFRTYGVLGVIQLIIFKVRTKLMFSNARIIRFPISIRGRKHINLGSRLTTGVGCRLEAYSDFNNGKTLIFGNNIQINDYVHITAMRKVTIGNNVLMASKIYISDCTHGYYDGGDNDSSPAESPINRKYKISEVLIEDNVWLGESVAVLPGVKIGKGSIIGANSVVTKNIPKNSIAVGSPAKVIKKYDEIKKKWMKVD